MSGGGDINGGGGASRRGSVDDGVAIDEPLWSPVETIALAKTAEAEDLAIRVVQLRREVTQLTQLNSQLHERLAGSKSPVLPVKFRSALHRK